MKLIYLKSALKCDSFDVAIDIKIQFFRVLVTIEPGSLLTTVRYHELFDYNCSFLNEFVLHLQDFFLFSEATY